jgi:cytochrome P450
LKVRLGSANRDEAAFEDPAVFDPTRQSSAYLAFRHGLHYCLGATLAKIEADVALRTFFDAISTVRLPPEFTPTPVNSATQYKLEALPLLVE